MTKGRTPRGQGKHTYLVEKPSQRQAVALFLMVLGIFSLLGLASMTHGIWLDGWIRLLRQAFGHGAFLVALLLMGCGYLLFHDVWPARFPRVWQKWIGLEVFLLALLGLLHLAVPGDDPLTMAQAGRGGGYVGLAVSNSIAQAIGYELCATLLFLVMIWGLSTALSVNVARLATQVTRIGTAAWPLLRQGIARLGHLAKVIQKRREALPVARKAATKRKEKSDSKPPIGLPLLKRSKPAPVMSEVFVKAREEGKLPPLDILEKTSLKAFEEGEIRRKARIIEETLEGFGLPVKVVEINHGPAVTQYGVEPGLIERRGRHGEASYSRVRVSKITSLVNDLALALAAAPIRIEAPVPGRSIVGIEVPNDEVALVSLRSIMESEAFARVKSPLKIALGQDVSGQPVVADLAKMPHLLIAGATGSGKSVCMNAIVSCLLFNNTPEQLKLLLIDPKMVELTAYNGIPHLLAPVVVDLDQVVGALTWLTKVMEERYRLFSQQHARNIEDYNAKVGRRSNGEILPYIVVVIDELADLMLKAPVEVEWAVCRLAQMARATGIHLVLATQRPSVDVVTGLIKANFPARISFAVTSSVDSRVMLDVNGAETLLGRGDMLFMAPDAARLVRVQGCFVSDREINALVAFWRSVVPAGGQANPDPPWSGMTTREEQDELLAQAIELVQKNGRVSTSLLQRRLRIGYPRAARLMDQLEEQGIIGPPEEGSRFRQAINTNSLRWDAKLEKELDADFAQELLHKGKGASRTGS